MNSISTACPSVVLLGPTCAWKSEAAEALADELSAEIISCDSMQIYRGLDIGTAKPSVETRRRIPYHLVDCLDFSEPYDVNRFVSYAQAGMRAIQARGKLAIVAGGTGLYARALVYGYELLPAAPAVFAEFNERYAAPGGREELLARLEAAATATGTALHEEVYRNPRRLIRACEVLALTGRLPWELQKKHDQPGENFRQLCVIPDFALLKDRIRRRTALMLERGWVEEARRADAVGLLASPTARQALGYREIIDCLSGRIAGGVGILPELLANRTIQYARRQLTWFRHQHPGAQVLSISDADHAPGQVITAALRRLAAELA